MALSQPSGRAPLTAEAREARKMERREKTCIFDGIVVFEKLRCGVSVFSEIAQVILEGRNLWGKIPDTPAS